MVLPLITGPYVARVLGPKGVGINTYTGAVVQYFVLIGGLGIALYGNRQIAYTKGNRAELSKTFWEIQSIKVFMVCFAYLIFLVYLIFAHQYKSYLIIQSIFIIATGFDISWLYEGIEDFKKTFVRNTLVRVISLFLILILVHKPSDVGKYILILAISNIGGYIALWPALSKILIKVNLFELRPVKHIKGILFLFIPYLTLNIYPIINKTLLKFFSGVNNSGFYEKSDVMIRMALTVITSVSAVLLPHTSRAFADKQFAEIKKLLKISFQIVSLMAFPLAFGMSAIAPKFGVYFYGNGFEPVGIAMFIESFAIIFMGWSSITGNQYLIPTNQTDLYSHSVLIGSLLNIVLDFPLILFFGLNGAAMATVFSEAFISLYQLFVIRSQIDYSDWFQDILKFSFASVVMFLFVYNLSKFLTMNFINLVIEVVFGGLIYTILVFLLKPSSLVLLKKSLKQFLLGKNKMFRRKE